MAEENHAAPLVVRPMDRITRFMRGMVNDPLETIRVIPEVLAARHDYRPTFTPDLDWQERLHKWLGLGWPCDDHVILHRILTDVRLELEQQGLRFGRFTTGIEYSDAEMNLSRAVWCAALHLKPSIVVETGVARGTTSRLILEAMNRNAHGHLCSIDLPYPFDTRFHKEIGAAVPPSRSYRDRWTYIRGSSRRRLRGLLRTTGQVDLFIHDSLHTGRNTKFEMDLMLNSMGPGGIMIIDDISSHKGFHEFVQEHPSFDSLVCEHSDITGSYFGIVQIH